jgi:hypothetical protein
LGGIARCIWTKGRIVSIEDDKAFAKLRTINLRSCPRLTFVLPLSWFYTLSSLETLCIVCCGDLSQVFPVEAMFLNELSTVRHLGGVLEFPKLKTSAYTGSPSCIRYVRPRCTPPSLRPSGCGDAGASSASRPPLRL